MSQPLTSLDAIATCCSSTGVIPGETAHWAGESWLKEISTVTFASVLGVSTTACALSRYRSGFSCAKTAGRKFQSRVVTATEEHAKLVDA